MKIWESAKTTFVLSATLSAAQLATMAMSPDQPTEFEVRGGNIVFDVSTNVPALSVHGKSNAMQARLQVRRTAESLLVGRIEASLSPASLTTGMGVRDEHMRKYIFTTDAGQVPDLQFAAESAVCPLTVPGKEVSCQLAGNMTIRGVTKPLTIAMKLKEENAQTIRAAGDAVVKLADYGIPAPSQFGVKTAEEVKVHLDFISKHALDTLSKGGTQ